jgi:hypothetical protein
MAGRIEATPVTDPRPASSERTRLGWASALIAAVALLAVPGGQAAVAIAGALGVLGAWYLLAPTYAFALGHVALAAVLPEGGAFARGASLVWVAAVEAGLLGMVLSSATEFREFSSSDPDGEGEMSSRSTSLAVVGAGLVLGWVVVGGLLAWASGRSSLGLPTAGALLVALTALAAYGLHRYQLVSLGLVSDGAGRDGGEERSGVGEGDGGDGGE